MNSIWTTAKNDSTSYFAALSKVLSLVLCQFCDELWVHTLHGNRWDRIENPCGIGVVRLAAYREGFLIFPSIIKPPEHGVPVAAIDTHVCYGTVTESQGGAAAIATYVDLSTPALSIVRATNMPIESASPHGPGHYLPGSSWDAPYRQITLQVLAPFGI